jgi:hypothetical protein
MLANVSVDGVVQPGEAPLTLKLTPGKHRVTVSAKGYQSKDLDIEVKAGDKLKQSVALVREEPPPAAVPPPVAPAPAPTPPPKPAEERSLVPAYVTLGIAGVGAIVGTIFGIQALGAKSDFDDNPTTDNADKAERNALIADMSFGVALTLGITGIVLLASGGDSDEAPPSASAPPRRKLVKLDVAPVLTPTTQGAAARFTF